MDKIGKLELATQILIKAAVNDILSKIMKGVAQELAQLVVKTADVVSAKDKSICKYRNCRQPSKGPRYKFLCAKHYVCTSANK